MIQVPKIPAIFLPCKFKIGKEKVIPQSGTRLSPLDAGFKSILKDIRRSDLYQFHQDILSSIRNVIKKGRYRAEAINSNRAEPVVRNREKRQPNARNATPAAEAPIM